MRKRPFTVGAAFESGTLYAAEEKEYHIYPSDCREVTGHGFAPVDEPVAAAFFLEGVRDVTIDLKGAKLVFHGRIAPFILSDCKNIRLKNFSVDYDRPYYTQAELVERDEAGITVRVSDGFPYSVEGGCFIAESEFWRQRLEGEHCLIQPYDKTTLSPAYGAGCILAACNFCDSVNPPMPVRILHAEQMGELVRFSGEFPESWKAGLMLEFMHEKRDKNAILAERCEKVEVSGVRLLHCAAMGFVGMFCRDILLERFDMYLSGGEKGLVTANADSVHCFHCEGKIVIRDCIFESMLDDAVNIHGNYNVVESAAGEKLVLRSYAAALGFIRWYKAGDRLNVYRGKTQETRGTFTVKEVNYESGAIYVTADAAIPAEAGDVVENAAVPELLIENCIAGRNRPRGFLLSSGGKTVVRGCTFSDCDCAIHFTGDTNYWYESGPVRDVTIEGCVFDNCGYCGQPYAIVVSPDFEPTEKVPYYHKNIKIVGNTFRTFTGGLLQARRAEGIVFKDNRVIESRAYPQAGLAPVAVTECGEAQIENV